MISSLPVGHSTPYEKFVMNKHLEAQKEIEISFLKKKDYFWRKMEGFSKPPSINQEDLHDERDEIRTV